MNKIFIKQVDKTIIIDQCDILFCQTLNNYSVIQLKNEESHTCSKCLTKLANDLNNDFLRISQSCIVNINYIKEIHSQKKQVLLSTGKYLDFTIKYSDLCSALESMFKSQVKHELVENRANFFGQLS